MKRLLLLCALILSFSCSAQSTEGIKFEEGDFSSILAKAKQSDKLVFIDIYATWCGPCKYMSSAVFTQKKVGDYFNSNFINAKFDAEKGEGVTLARRYEVTAYPTFLLVNGDGDLVGKMVGGSPADDFIKQISELAK